MQCHVVRVLFTISLCGLIVAAQPKRTFTLEDDRFVRDGKATQLISGRSVLHALLCMTLRVISAVYPES